MASVFRLCNSHADFLCKRECILEKNIAMINIELMYLSTKENLRRGTKNRDYLEKKQ